MGEKGKKHEILLPGFVVCLLFCRYITTMAQANIEN